MIFSKTLRHYLAYILPQKKVDIFTSVFVTLLCMVLAVIDLYDTKRIYPISNNSDEMIIDVARIAYARAAGRGGEHIKLIEKNTNQCYYSTDMGTGNRLRRKLGFNVNGQIIANTNTSVVFIPYYKLKSTGEIMGFISRITMNGRVIYQASDDYIRSKIRSRMLIDGIFQFFYVFLCVYIYALITQILFLSNKRS